MEYLIPDVLPSETLEKVQALFEQAEFVDGRVSSGSRLANVKDNEQVSEGTDIEKEMTQLVHESLQANMVFRNIAMPLKLSPPLFARYGPGKTYGEHIDAAVMSPTRPMRSDMSMTIFLNDGSEYEGGELVLHTDLVPRGIKSRAGNAVLYPTYAVHKVAAVKSGIRKVCVLWLQSEVRLPEHRQTLSDLIRLKAYLSEQHDMTHPEMVRLEKVLQNLRRLWIEL